MSPRSGNRVVSGLKTIWGVFFRLFPCPTPVGYRAVGKPGRKSPVLVTCNFDLTVKRVTHVLRKANIDTWLVVADSKGVNVWCAAGGDEFTTHSVVSAVKTSGIDREVDHRRLILPPLSAPAVRRDKVHEETGWSAVWGPDYAIDLPRFLKEHHRDESMRRARYDWRQRLDTALGSLFPIYLLGAVGFTVLAPALLIPYLVAGAATFVFFMLLCPWLPGKHGLTKALLADILLFAVLIASLVVMPLALPVHATIAIAMVTMVVWGMELGGLASTLPSDLDPFMAKLGIGALGNVEWAGTVRTDLLLGKRKLTYFTDRCDGCRGCFETCPTFCWEMDDHKGAVFARPEDCTSCRACLVQCPTDAIEAVLTAPAPTPGAHLSLVKNPDDVAGGQS